MMTTSTFESVLAWILRATITAGLLSVCSHIPIYNFVYPVNISRNEAPSNTISSSSGGGHAHFGKA